MSTNGYLPGIASAYEHLGARLPEIAKADSRHRPHWTQADIDAVAALLQLPASREQIALARIEGLTTYHDYSQDSRKRIHVITRKALGLPT